MGHGMVDCYNKSTAIGDSRGGPTDEPDVIGKEAWKLLKSYNFDSKELRGIGMQIQKLDDEAGGAAAELPAGQSRLTFAKAGPSKQRVDAEMIDDDEPPSDATHRLSARDDVFGLTSASQIDHSVLESLPADLRAEILASLDKAGPSTTTARSNTIATSRPAQEIDLTSDDDVPQQTRSQSLPPAGSQPKDGLAVPAPPTKAASMSPTKAQEKARADVRHITKQLAPKRKIPFVSPTKAALFRDKPASSGVGISDDELKSLGVDPAFFRELPQDIQREQLSLLRQSKPSKAWGALAAQGNHAKSRSPSVGARPPPAPIPVASYTILPQIKKLSKPEEIQDMIKEWVRYRKSEGPISAEVERIQNFLVKSAASGVGLENVSSILRYWRRLLRERWKLEEAGTSDVIDLDVSVTGQAWWGAFRKVKGKVDEVVKKRLGCCLALGR